MAEQDRLRADLTTGASAVVRHLAVTRGVEPGRVMTDALNLMRFINEVLNNGGQVELVQPSGVTEELRFKGVLGRPIR